MSIQTSETRAGVARYINLDLATWWRTILDSSKFACQYFVLNRVVMNSNEDALVLEM